MIRTMRATVLLTVDDTGMARLVRHLVPPGREMYLTTDGFMAIGTVRILALDAPKGFDAPPKGEQ